MTATAEPLPAKASIQLSSMRDVMCGLRKDLYSRYCVTVLKAFIDDSGSDGESIWYVLAGYLGTVQGWDQFDPDWIKVLHAHPRIEYFKGSEAESLRPEGQWAGITPKERDAKIDALIEVIGKYARRSICVRLRQRDYDQIVKGNLPDKWDSPYYLLFIFSIGAAINIERLDGESEHVDFVFDSDQKHQRQFELVVPSLNRMSSLDGRFINAVRRDEKHFLPLQAADLLAWQTRRFVDPNGGPARKHFYDARDCPPKKHELFIVDRRMLIDMVQDLRDTAAERAPSLGRSPDLRTWK